MRITAIYVTFHPDKNFRLRINEVVKQCCLVVIVDNTPGGHSFTSDELQGVTLVQDGKNKGLGPALNLGLDRAKSLGCDAVVLFDQDSSPRPNFISELLKGLRNAGPRAIVGPLLVDDALTSISYDRRKLTSNSRQAVTSPQLKLVTCVATSGMAFSISELSDADSFSESLFLDFVDFDWCWRLKEKGWSTYRLTSLEMPHRLGLAQRRILWLTYHIPAPFRHYFQFRDGLKLAGTSYVPIYSRFRLCLILIPKLIVYPMLLESGLERLIWMLRGIRDAILGVKGAGSASAKLQVNSSNMLN